MSKKMGKIIIKVPLVTWRNGHPRYIPGAKQRALGLRGLDLRHPDGQWFTAEQCMEWSEQKQADIAALISGAPQKPKKRRNGSLGEIVAAWLSSPRMRGKTITEGRKTRRPLSDNTVRGYRGSANILMKFDQGDVWAATAALLTPRMLANIIDNLEKRHGLAQARAVRAMLSACFSWALANGKMRTNPMKDAAPLPTLPPRLRVASIQAITALVAMADAMELFEIGDMIVLGVWTGQRQGDRLSLSQWKITPEGITFNQSKKHGAPLLIPAAKILLDRLEGAKTRRQDWRVNYPNVVLDEKRRRPLSGDWYRKQFAKVRASAIKGDAEKGLAPCPELKGFRDQDLRDTAVTWLSLAHVSKFGIASITGHSLKTIDNILAHYVGPHPDLAREAIGKLSNWYQQEQSK